MDRERRITFEILKCPVKGNSTMTEMGVVLEKLFELLQKDTLHTLYTLLKDIVEEIWEHEADTDVNITIIKAGYAISGF